MGIGTSFGAYHDNSFDMRVERFKDLANSVQNMDRAGETQPPPTLDQNVVTPEDQRTNKQLDDAEQNQFGPGLPIGWFSNAEAKPSPIELPKPPAQRNESYPSPVDTQVPALGEDTGNESFIKADQGRAFRTPFQSGMTDKQVLNRITEDADPMEKADASAAFAQAEVAKHRSAITTLGYDPSKVVLERKNLNVAGMYSNRGETDRMLYRLPEQSPSALMHESAHRGMTTLENQSPEAREILDDMRAKITHRYKDTRASDIDEYIVRHLMATKMGDPENIPEHSVSIAQRGSALKMFKQNPELQKNMDRLEEIAAEMVKNKNQGKPR